MKNPPKYKNQPIEVQMTMQGQELEDELYKIANEAVGLASKKVMFHITEYNEILNEVYLVLYKKDKNNEQSRKSKLMNMIKEGSGPQVYSYIKKIAQSVIRDMIQKRGIDNNMNAPLVVIDNHHYCNDDYYTIGNFRKQLKSLREDSGEFFEIKAHSSDRQWNSINKFRKGEKLTTSESVDITKVMYKVVSYQHVFDSRKKP